MEREGGTTEHQPQGGSQQQQQQQQGHEQQGQDQIQQQGEQEQAGGEQEQAQGLSPEAMREVLQALSLKELREYLVSEVGDNRKYLFYSKTNLINRILAAVVPNAGAAVTPPKVGPPSPSSPAGLTGSGKRTRSSSGKAKAEEEVPPPATPAGLCRNSACSAPLSPQEHFCKRCSCCICHRFDENKDPSLWIVCGDDDVGGAASSTSCRLSCHLECAIGKELAGSHGDLDTGFRCSGCSTITNLLGLWKKQLVQAKAARRVDVLYHRLMVASQLMDGTKEYKVLQGIVQEAIDELVKEIGPQSPGNLSRDIVLRTSCGPKVIELIGKALSSLPDAYLAKDIPPEIRVPQLHIIFKEVTSSSIMLAVVDRSPASGSSNIFCYRLWHRKNRETFRRLPTITMLPTQMAKVTELKPNSGYVFKIVAFSNRGEEGSCEGRVYTLADPQAPTGTTTTTTNGAANGAAKGVTTSVPPPRAKENDSFHSCSEGDKAVNEEEISSAMKTPAAKRPKVEAAPEVKASEGATPMEGVKDEGATMDAGGSKMVEPAVKEVVPRGGEPVPEVTMRDEGVIDPVPVAAVEHPNEDQQSNPDYGEVVPAAKDETGTTGTTTATTTTTSDDQNINNNNAKMKITNNINNSIAKNTKNRISRSSNSKNKQELPVVLALGAQGDAPPKEISNVPAATDNNVNSQAMVTKVTDKGFEYCVRMVRWLECEGHISPDFRKRFFTWFGLKASEHEKRVVNIYISTMLDDPAGLAGQLVDAFEVAIASTRRKSDDVVC